MLLYALNFVLTFLHRLLTSESGVVQPFVANESGFISSRRGLPVAWTFGVLVVASALLGTPEAVRADHGGDHSQHLFGVIGSSCNDSDRCWYDCLSRYGYDPNSRCRSDGCYCYCSDYTGP